MINKHTFENWKPFYPYVILFLGAFVVLSTTALAPFANKLTNVDSNVFIYCSKQILKGKIMYKEIFDHKGPVLYVFNIIGLFIGGGNTTGIWFVELMSLFVSSVFIYKSVNLYFDRSVSLTSTLSYLFMIFLLLEGNEGNCPEEYAIPFISMSMYYFLCFLKNGNIKNYHFAIIAFCCICTILLKPNFIALWMAGYFCIFIILLKNKKLKELITIFILTVITFAVVCMPFAIYFFYTDSWADFKFCFWDFNRAYSDTSFYSIMLRTCRRFWYQGHFWLSLIGRIHVVSFILIGIIYFKHLKFKTEAYFILLALILTVVMISIGILFELLHYYLLFVPLLVFLYAAVCQFIKKKLFVNPLLITGLLILSFSFVSIKRFNVAYKTKNPNEGLVLFIKENSGKTDKITVVGHDCLIYNFSNRESVSKYSYQFPIVGVEKYKDLITEYYMKDIKSGKPRIIVTGLSNDYFEPYFKNLNEILETEYEKVTIANSIYCCWVRKQ